MSKQTEQPESLTIEQKLDYMAMALSLLGIKFDYPTLYAILRMYDEACITDGDVSFKKVRAILDEVAAKYPAQPQPEATAEQAAPPKRFVPMKPAKKKK